MQLDQPAHLLGADISGWFAPFDEPIAFGFDFSDLFGDHLEPLPFALDFDLQPCRYRLSVASPHLIKTFTPVCIRYPKRPDAMHDQQGFDPVQMASTFAHKPLPFTVEPPRILFLGRWCPYHAATLRIALYEPHNRPE
jgi:hypothetical protein